MKCLILKIFTTERLLNFCILCHVFMNISNMKRRCNSNKAMSKCSLYNPVITFRNLSSHSGSLEHTAGWVRQRIKGIRSRTSCSLKVKTSLQSCFESCLADTHIQKPSVLWIRAAVQQWLQMASVEECNRDFVMEKAMLKIFICIKISEGFLVIFFS